MPQDLARSRQLGARLRAGYVTLFARSAGVILLAVGLAKIVTTYGGTDILRHTEPITGLSFRTVLGGVGMVEVIIGALALKEGGTMRMLTVVTGLATAIGIYRLGLWWIGYEKPCSCLGGFGDMFNIPPVVLDAGMKLILFYLITGSVAALIVAARGKTENLGQYRKKVMPTL